MRKHIKRRALTLGERERIATYKAMGKSRREIGRLLNRDHSIIVRELKRNSRPHPLMTGYVHHLAHDQSRVRKQESGQRERLKDDFTRNYVHEKLKLGWTPEQIGLRLAIEHKGYSISHEAIYQYIYIDYKEGIKHLARKHPKRWSKGYGRKKKKSSIPGRVGIHDRPQGINSRWFYGHWETDAIESNKSRCIINVNLERKTRFVRLCKLPTKHAKHTQKAVSDALKDFPEKMRRSITYDNGSENYDHLITNSILGTKSYFCEPYHSWEKGAVENINSLIRRFIPKKTDLATVTHEELQKIEDLLNDRPRKCLGFKTPREVFYKYCKQQV